MSLGLARHASRLKHKTWSNASKWGHVCKWLACFSCPQPHPLLKREWMAQERVGGGGVLPAPPPSAPCTSTPYGLRRRPRPLHAESTPSHAGSAPPPLHAASTPPHAGSVPPPLHAGSMSVPEHWVNTPCPMHAGLMPLSSACGVDAPAC